MSWLSNAWDYISNGFTNGAVQGATNGITGGSTGGGGAPSLGSSFISSLVNSIPSAAQTFLKPDAPQSYQNTQAGFEALQALEREKLAQELAIAQMNAAAGGAGAGAAIQTAKINARTALAQLKEKQMADILAAQLGEYKARGDLLGNASTNTIAALQKAGETGQAGLQNAAGLLARFAR